MFSRLPFGKRNDVSIPLMSGKFKAFKEGWKNAIGHKFEGLDYEVIQNDLYQRDMIIKTPWTFKRREIMRWIVSMLIGICTALVGFFIVSVGNLITDAKFTLTLSQMHHCDSTAICFWVPFLVWVSLSTGLVFLASLFVAFEPVAAGSGIPEIKCYLNGIKIPRVTRMVTLIAKATGVLFSVAGGLAVGKEGPMIHSGAIIGAGVSQGNFVAFGKDLGLFRYFRNDREKRDFVSSGAAAGVAAAFGAPIGGVLFSIEEGASFWNQNLTWRSMFCSMVCSFILNVLLSGTSGHSWGLLSQPGLLSFGEFKDVPYDARQLPFMCLLGIVGGLCGAVFNWSNIQLTKLRLLYRHKRWARALEATFVGLLTATLTFSVPYVLPHCRTPATPLPPDQMLRYQFYCAEGQLNGHAELFFSPWEDSIKALFHGTEDYSFRSLGVFFGIYSFLAMITYGIGVPSGLFVPSLLAGSAMGRLLGQLFNLIFPNLNLNPGGFALIGAAAFLGGVVRMTISLTVILIESTNDISYGMPIMLTLMISKWVGDYFTEGIYDYHIELNKIPLLGWDAPFNMRSVKTSEFMSHPPVTFQEVERVENIINVLKSTTHNGFPVTKSDGKFMGIILRHQLTILLKKKNIFRNTRAILDRRPNGWIHFETRLCGSLSQIPRGARCQRDARRDAIFHQPCSILQCTTSNSIT
eukprot:TRINITY_DN7_c2_g1_i2.p1 TRINITY_DN7_c2_g1~~TRINITY_DN7_c2_g1_i2.p1  ORF type:complete len:691 (-),score=162.65 TRINITY_DN7_c2_g1_i2:323-2395(-)